MNATLEFKINKAIEESLPAELGDALKKRLEAADKLEVNYKGLETKFEMAQKENGQLKERIDTSDRLLAKHTALEVRENAVRIREQKADTLELEHKLKAEERVTAGYKDILGGLVRNVEYRNQIFTNEPIAIPGGPGGYGSVVQHQGSKTETKEAK